MTTFFLTPDKGLCINATAIAEIEVADRHAYDETPTWGVTITSSAGQIWVIASSLPSFAAASAYIVTLARLLSKEIGSGGSVITDADVRSSMNEAKACMSEAKAA